MAVSYDIRPFQIYDGTNQAKFIPAYSDAIFQIKTTTTISGVFNYKFLVDIYMQTTQVLRLKVEPNAENKGVFDVSRIIQDYVQTEEVAHNQNYSIHKVRDFSRSNDNASMFSVRVGEEYATSQGGTITVYDGNGNAGNPAVSSGGFRFWNGVNQWSDSSEGNEGFRNNWQTYFLRGTDRRALSQFAPSSTIKQKIGSNDYHTLYIMYGRVGGDSNASDGYSLAGTSTTSGKAVITFYDSSGSTTGSAISYTTKMFDGGATAMGNKASGFDNFLYVGVGTQNLIDDGQTVPSDTAYYTVVFKNNSDTQLSDIYYFEIDNCNGKSYNQVRLAWLNTLGGFDYFTFRQKNVTRIENKKTYYGRQHGEWNINTYRQRIHERGKATINVSAIEKLFLNTHLITESEANALQDLFSSPEVYMFEGTKVIPVCVLDSSYTKKTSANDKIIQYQLSIQKAHGIKVQNG